MQPVSASLRRLTVIALAMFGMSTIPACETTSSSSGPMVEFSISPSRTKAMVGETVSISTQTANVAGSNSQIEWHATGGQLEERQNGRVALVTFDEPGSYNISANLIADGVQVMSDTTTIHVRSMQPRPTIQQQGQRQDQRRQQSDVRQDRENRLQQDRERLDDTMD